MPKIHPRPVLAESRSRRAAEVATEKAVTATGGDEVVTAAAAVVVVAEAVETASTAVGEAADEVAPAAAGKTATTTDAVADKVGFHSGEARTNIATRKELVAAATK